MLATLACCMLAVLSFHGSLCCVQHMVCVGRKRRMGTGWCFYCRIRSPSMCCVSVQLKCAWTQVLCFYCRTRLLCVVRWGHLRCALTQVLRSFGYVTTGFVVSTCCVCVRFHRPMDAGLVLRAQSLVVVLLQELLLCLVRFQQAH